MDKSLGTNLFFGAFGHTTDTNTTSPAQPAISSDFQHCIGWEGNFKRIAALFSNFRSKTQVIR